MIYPLCIKMISQFWVCNKSDDSCFLQQTASLYNWAAVNCDWDYKLIADQESCATPGSAYQRQPISKPSQLGRATALSLTCSAYRTHLSHSTVSASCCSLSSCWDLKAVVKLTPWCLRAHPSSRVQGVFCFSRVSEVTWGGGFMLNLDRKREKKVLVTHPQ